MRWALARTALGLAACGSTAALPSGGVPSLIVTPSAGAVSHTCQPSEISVDVTPMQSGATAGVLVRMTNAEAGRCGLVGYPTVALRGAQLHVSDGGGTLFGNPSAFHVVLEPGQTAYVGVEWSSSGRDCAGGDTLDVAFAGESSPLAVATGSITVCGGAVTVTPVTDTAPATPAGAPSGTPAATSTP